MSFTLSFFKFKKSLEQEIRIFWTNQVAFRLSENTFDESLPENLKLTKIWGVASPFSYLDISIPELKEQLKQGKNFTMQNLIVSFTMVFEQFLFDTLRHTIYLQPDLLKNSGMQIELSAISTTLGEKGDLLNWIATTYADRINRKETHIEIYQRIAKLMLRDIKDVQPLLIYWHNVTLLRNAIVHNNRRVTNELSINWPDKFSNEGKSIIIEENLIKVIQKSMLKIAKKIDSIVQLVVVKDADAKLLAREVFVRHGIENPNHIARIIHNNLSYKIDQISIEAALAQQRRENKLTTDIIFDSFFDSIVIE
jgi:hypothetical protein